MIVALIIFIALSIIEAILLFILLKAVQKSKKIIGTQAGNIQVLKQYYDTYQKSILDHISTEKEAHNADDEAAQKIISDIISNNNANSVDKLCDNTSNSRNKGTKG